MSSSKLFQPIKVGDVTLQHRIIMAPLTRFRANLKHEQEDIAVEYYKQRASVPGTLLVSEGVFVTGRAGGGKHIPGIWSEEQIKRWKKITNAVHEQGSFIYLQLWALGRAASAEALAEEDASFDYIGAGSVKLSDRDRAPRALTVPEIKEFVQFYATAASNAVHKAGFDGVEIHGAHGYLVDQFIQDNSNNRTDEYGGSIENRTRFALEVIDAVSKAVGPQKVGIRLSPWNPWQDMRMSDPIPTFSRLVTRIRDEHPNFGYIHVVEPRLAGIADREAQEGESNDFLREIWGPRVYIAAGGFTREDAIKTAEEKGGLIAYGRYFISNPDLPRRLKENITLTPYNRETFYTPEDPVGYIDYPFAGAEAISAAA